MVYKVKELTDYQNIVTGVTMSKPIKEKL